MMPIIDMRYHPPTPEYKQNIKELEQYVATHYPIAHMPHPDWDAQRLEDHVKNMEKLDCIGVITGKFFTAMTVPTNDQVKSLADKYPKRFLPVGGIDASPEKRRTTQDEIDKIAKVLKFKGILMQPGWQETPMLADDRRLYPLYSQCNDLGLFVGIALGPYCGPTTAFSSPVQVEKVTMDFPNLKIHLYHGGYPYIEDTIALMTRFKNIWCSPDAYVMLGHAQEQYLYMVKMPRFADRMLFGSSMPFGLGIEKTLEWYDKNWALEPQIAERYFYKNACELFGIET